MLTGITVLFECCIFAFLQSINVQTRPAILSLLMILLVSVVYFFELARSRVLKPVAFPLMLGYCMRVFLVLFDIYGRAFYTLPNSGSDAEMFYKQAIRYTMGNEANSAFVKVTGEIFSWIGVSRLYVQFLLMLCSIVALHMLARMMRKLNVDRTVQQQVMYVVCLLPNFAILSSIFLRESIVVVFVTASLYCFVGWWSKNSEWRFLLAFVLVFCGARFHSGIVGVAAGYILVRLLYDKKNGVFRLSLSNILVSLVFIFVFTYLFLNYKDVLFSKMVNIESVEDIASGAVRGGSSYAAYVGDSSSPLNMIIYSPLRIIFFLFSPFPWHWRGLSDIIAFCLNSVFYFWAVCAALCYVKRPEGRNRNIVVALLIVGVCTVFVFAWGVSNTGTAVRHRDKMVVLYAMLIALTRRSDQRDCRVRVGGT